MSCSPLKKKFKEEGGANDCVQNHRQHQFQILFKKKQNVFYCDHLQTVLAAIKSRDEYNNLKWSDERLVIEQGSGDRISTVPTHFPCFLVNEGETLTVKQSQYQNERVKATDQTPSFLSKESYSVFYISSETGENSTDREVFVTRQKKKLRSFCVYGEEGMTVEEALEQDGRFNDIKGFHLIDNDDENRVIQSNSKIDSLQGQKFKIAFKQNPVDRSKQKGTPGASCKTKQTPDNAAASQTSQSENTERAREEAAIRRAIEQRGARVMEGCSDADRAEIYKILLKQFPDLKALMEKRFPGDTFTEELKLTEEKFGKIQQSFSHFHIMEKLIEMGRSVCKVAVEEDYCTGTGFVLYDNVIMTNAHLFKRFRDGDKLREGTNVHVIFNYHSSVELPKPFSYKVDQAHIVLIEDALDYAVLRVQPCSQTKKMKLPAGLLKNIGDMPEDGGACIIGHPGGDLKRIDLTCAIRMEERRQDVENKMLPFKDIPFIVHQLKQQNIDSILQGGAKADKVFTYDTFMYHGASGSPVFDALGRVCGLHTAGFVYGFPQPNNSVIEFAYSMKNIMTHFVGMLKERNFSNDLEMVQKAAESNSVMGEICRSLGIHRQKAQVEVPQVEVPQVEVPQVEVPQVEVPPGNSPPGSEPMDLD